MTIFVKSVQTTLIYLSFGVFFIDKATGATLDPRLLCSPFFLATTQAYDRSCQHTRLYFNIVLFTSPVHFSKYLNIHVVHLRFEYGYNVMYRVVAHHGLLCVHLASCG